MPCVLVTVGTHREVGLRAVGSKPDRVVILAPDELQARAVTQLLAEVGWTGTTSVLPLPTDLKATDDFVKKLLAVPGRTAVLTSGVPDLAVAIAGVGSLDAGEVLPDGAAILKDTDPPLYAVARAALWAHLRGAFYEAPPGGPAAGPVYVVLRERTGEERARAGTSVATTGRRYAEVAAVAPDVALDPRLGALSDDKLNSLVIEVLALEAPVDVKDPSELDPHTYGVVVTGSGQRGVVMPGTPGITTSAQQVEQARKKANLPKGAAYTVQRFAVTLSTSP